MVGPVFSVTLPFRGILKEITSEGYGALDELRGKAIRYLDKKKPKDRERITIYHKGQKHGVLYYHDDIFHHGYVYETKNHVFTLNKNGSWNGMRKK